MYYLIEHNRITKETEYKEYTDYTEARAVALKKEQEHFRNKENEIEVVIFEADSIENLTRTHSRYFVDRNPSKELTKTDESIATVFLGAGVAIGLVALAAHLLSKKDE